MPVYELEAGDMMVLGDGTRLTVLAVTGDAALFGVSPPPPAEEFADGRVLPRAALMVSPSNN